MQISITGRRVELHPDTVTAMERRLHYALGCFDHAISGLTVRISDINGPRGGHDKECLIMVRLRQGEREVALDFPQHMTLELKVDDEKKKRKGTKRHLEIELEWYSDTGEGPSGVTIE